AFLDTSPLPFNFADPNFPAPTIAVWEKSRHPWLSLPPDTPPPSAWGSRGETDDPENRRLSIKRRQAWRPGICLRLRRYQHGDPSNVIAFTVVCCCASCDDS